jgi:hypothetical protein
MESGKLGSCRRWTVQLARHAHGDQGRGDFFSQVLDGAAARPFDPDCLGRCGRHAHELHGGFHTQLPGTERGRDARQPFEPQSQSSLG